MAKPKYFILLALLMVSLVGCSTRAFGKLTSDVQPIDATEVVRSIQFIDESELGPVYDISFTVPQDWVGNFETRLEGSTLIFEMETDNARGAPIFFVEALSEAQYWEQIGSYPGQYTNIIVTPDTYVIYYLPLDSFYSGLSDDEYADLAAQVPEIVASFELLN